MIILQVMDGHINLRHPVSLWGVAEGADEEDSYESLYMEMTS